MRRHRVTAGAHRAGRVRPPSPTPPHSSWGCSHGFASNDSSLPGVDSAEDPLASKKDLCSSALAASCLNLSRAYPSTALRVRLDSGRDLLVPEQTRALWRLSGSGSDVAVFALREGNTMRPWGDKLAATKVVLTQTLTWAARPFIIFQARVRQTYLLLDSQNTMSRRAGRAVCDQSKSIVEITRRRSP